jgi:phosphoribosylanthranilate isomerase
MIKPAVKICCIQSVEETKLAIKYGACALGLVSEMPSGPGVISEGLIAEIVKHVPLNIDTFLLTSKTSAKEIIAQQKRCKTNTLQIVDRVEHTVYKKLREELPGISLVQVVHVTGNKSVDEAVKVSQFVDAILLDSGNQELEVKELGGTGRTHDWKSSRMIVENVRVPVFLAGGINAGNVLDAVKEVHPFGLDLCSGVRVDGKLNEELLKDFFDKVNSVV